MTRKTKVAVIGSGNIGTDLMIKVLRLGEHLEMGAMVGIDPASDGLARAARLGVPTTHEGVDGLIAHGRLRRHRHRLRRHVGQARTSKNDAFLRKLAPYGMRLVDLTPAAIGPYVRPGRQPARPPRRGQRQHGHLRRPGHDPDRRRGPRVRRCPTPRSSPRSPRKIGRSRHPRQHRRVHRDDRAGDRGRRRREDAARRSSSSTRPSRR